ncbi:MAG TPA: hypothetical protein PK280_12460 [Planctomycetota bacterium]|nr:hypothetical protein [Planctomycetota bacterium]
MRHLAFCAALTFFAAWALGTSGCGKPKAGSGPAAGLTGVSDGGPSAAAKTAPLPGSQGELQNIAGCWRELDAEMAREQLRFKVIAAKAWAMAGSSDQIMKLAERSTGSPAVPPKGSGAGEINKLAFATAMDDAKFAEVFRNIELIGINAKNLAVSAGDIDAAGTRKWWGQLDNLCRGVCAEIAPAPAPAPAAPASPAGRN